MFFLFYFVKIRNSTYYNPMVDEISHCLVSGCHYLYYKCNGFHPFILIQNQYIQCIETSLLNKSIFLEMVLGHLIFGFSCITLHQFCFFSKINVVAYCILNLQLDTRSKLLTFYTVL